VRDTLGAIEILVEGDVAFTAFKKWGYGTGSENLRYAEWNSLTIIIHAGVQITWSCLLGLTRRTVIFLFGVLRLSRAA